MWWGSAHFSPGGTLGVGFESRTLCLEHELPALGIPPTPISYSLQSLGCGLHALLSHCRSLLQALQQCPRPLSEVFSPDQGHLPGGVIKGYPLCQPAPGAALSVKAPQGCVHLSHPLLFSACLFTVTPLLRSTHLGPWCHVRSLRSPF